MGLELSQCGFSCRYFSIVTIIFTLLLWCIEAKNKIIEDNVVVDKLETDNF